MNILQPHDLGVAPLWLLEGRKTVEQVVLLWIWQAELAGRKWTFSAISRQGKISAGTVKKVCTDLEKAGILVAREDSRPGPYSIHTEIVPAARPAPVVPAKKKEPLPGWVFRAVKIWHAHRGIAGPGRIHNALKGAMQAEDRETVLKAFADYAEYGDRRFDTLFRFAENLVKWLPQQGTQEKGLSFADF